MATGSVKFSTTPRATASSPTRPAATHAFVHMTAVQAAGMNTLEKEQRLSYDLENDKRGKTSAVNLQNA